MPFWIVFIFIVLAAFGRSLAPAPLSKLILPGTAAVLSVCVLLLGNRRSRRFDATTGRPNRSALKDALQTSGLLAIFAVASFFLPEPAPMTRWDLPSSAPANPEALDNRMADALFPEYRPSAGPTIWSSSDLDRELTKLDCPRLKEVLGLLDNLRDLSVKEAHSGRSIYQSGTYDVKLFTHDQFNERVEAKQYWKLKDSDYFEWLQRGFLDIPPGRKNGFSSKKPAYLWVREKFRSIIAFEIEKCGTSRNKR